MFGFFDRIYVGRIYRIFYARFCFEGFHFGYLLRFYSRFYLRICLRVCGFCLLVLCVSGCGFKGDPYYSEPSHAVGFDDLDNISTRME